MDTCLVSWHTISIHIIMATSWPRTEGSMAEYRQHLSRFGNRYSYMHIILRSNAMHISIRLMWLIEHVELGDDWPDVSIHIHAHTHTSIACTDANQLASLSLSHEPIQSHYCLNIASQYISSMSIFPCKWTCLNKYICLWYICTAHVHTH